VTTVRLPLPDPDLRALVAGETIIGFVEPGTVAPGDGVALVATGPRSPEELKPAYQRWADAGIPPGNWSARVEAVSPAASLDPVDGSARHVLANPGEGDLVVLRVSGADGPVLTDAAFSARLKSLDSAMRR